MILKRKLVTLYEGEQTSGVRGGQVYWQRLLAHLEPDFDIITANRKALGVEGVVSGREYAAAVQRFLGEKSFRGPIVHDGSSFYQMVDTNRMLRKNGWGPIINFLQEWVPAREPSFRMRLHMSRFMLRFVHGVDAHVAVSDWLKQRLVRIGVPPSRVDVARPGVSEACFESARKSTRSSSPTLRVVTAGLYHPSKGQSLLVEALGIVAEKSPQRLSKLRVDMYGSIPEGPNRDYYDGLHARIGQLGLGSVVELHGHTSQQQLWDTFGQADVFAFMAQGEGLPLVVMEAMLHGCVPVIPSGSPMEPLMKDGRFGSAIKPKPAALASELMRIHERLESNRGWHDDIARAGYDETLDWDEASEACANFIRARIG